MARPRRLRMRSELERVLDVIKAQEGYLEKASNSNLDSKTGNAGKGNYTKYGRDLHAWFPELGDTFGAAYAWCLQLIVWVFCVALGLERAKNLLCGCLTAYTPTMAQAYMDAGQWSSKPKVGALIFFADPAKKSASRPYGIYHVELVTGVSASRVYTDGGNTNAGSSVVANGGGVAAKSYDISNPKIFGYGIPDYQGGAAKVSAPDELAALDPIAHDVWVESLWIDYLYREPDEDEKKDNYKHSAIKLLYKLRTSEEGRRAWITACYCLILDRKPREDEIQTWLAAMKDGTTRKDILRKIRKSQEAKEKEN
jgi:hypothetical protein